MESYKIARIDESIKRLQQQREEIIKNGRPNDNRVRRLRTPIENEYLCIQESIIDDNSSNEYFDLQLEIADGKIEIDEWLQWLEGGWFSYTGKLKRYKADKYTFKLVPKDLVFDLLIHKY